MSEPPKLRVLDLFSGIGGFSLGLERTGGFETVAFCEIDPFCRRVLAKHWPEVPCYDDVRTLTAERLAGDGIGVDVICGGFPCQDISFAGAGAGIDAARSGLWKHYARLIGEVRPRYVIVENVAALLVRGLESVLGDLSAIGYDAEWHCIPAAAVGAPHRRDRVWILAYPSSERSGETRQLRYNQYAERPAGGGAAIDPMADADKERRLERTGACGQRTGRSEPADSGNLSDADRDDGRSRRTRGSDTGSSGQRVAEQTFRDADSAGLAQRQSEPGNSRPKLTTAERTDWWLVEPDVGRVAHGVPGRVDRLRSLGNAVVPQVVEMIGHAILFDDPPPLPREPAFSCEANHGTNQPRPK